MLDPMSGNLTCMLLVLTVACGSRTAPGPSSRGPHKPGVEITLYRDHAVIAHRLEVEIPPASTATVKLRIAAGAEPDEIYLVDKSALEIRQVRVIGAPTKPETCDEVSCVLESYEHACCAKFKKPVPAASALTVGVPNKLGGPIEVELAIGGPSAGTFSVLVGYRTPRIDWDAAYTLITSGAHGELRGALAIRNATGIAFPDARLRVADSQHAAVTARLKQIEAKANGTLDKKKEDTSPVGMPREVSRIDLLEGDTRVELLGPVTRPLRSMLVFDPVGSGYDYKHTQPVQDPALGAVTPGTKLVESLALDRPEAFRLLPGGPVRVLQRRPDGSLLLLSEAPLFGEATLAASIDVIPLHTAERVSGKRERRELTIDNDRRRIVEEFVLTIDNMRERPIDVLLREHLYRGQSWTIAYRSTFDAKQEGVQQLTMSTVVPARGKQTVRYVVVYSWDP